MAVKESAGFLMYKDNGDTNLFFPITTVDNVDGMDEIEESLNQTVRFTEQTLTDEQKSQVRENIGAMSSDYMPTIGEDDNNKLLMVQNGQWVATPLNVFTNNPVVNGVNAIEPNIYYDFGRVDSLDITLVEADDTIMNEYCFEFTPSERFTTLKITPQPRWAMPIQIVPGKVHQASILRGIGVMVCA